MKLHAIFEAKYHRDEGHIELTQAPPQKDVKFNRVVGQAWPYKVFYKGKQVFNTVIQGGITDKLGEVLKQHNHDHNDLAYFDSQESYLGYVPSKDMFVMGFDTWGEEEISGLPDDEEEDTYTGQYEPELYNIVFFKLNKNVVSWYEVWDMPSKMMYPRGLQALQKGFPDLVDIRLD